MLTKMVNGREVPISGAGSGGSGGGGSAAEITYDSLSTGLNATNVQEAIDQSFLIGNQIVAYKEKSPAEKAHAVGEYIRYNTVLYRVKAAISIGDDLVSTGDNANIEVPTLPELTNVYTPDEGGGGSGSADDVSYDNTTSGLEATNVQDAIDESLTISSYIVAVKEVSPATSAHSIGDYIRYNGITYRVKSNIEIGDTIVSTGDDANIEDANLPDMTTIFTPDSMQTMQPASEVSYDNSSSGLTATNIQDSVDEISNEKADKVASATNGNIASLNATGNLTDSGIKGDVSTTTLNGNPLSFTIDSEQVVRDCVITLNPIQAGTGDPSPSNIRAISGYDKVILSKGKNQFFCAIEVGSYAGADKDNTTNRRLRSSELIPIDSNITYNISFVGDSSANVIINYINSARELIGQSGWLLSGANFTTPQGTVKIGIIFKESPDRIMTISDISNIQLEFGSTATTYEAPDIITDSFTETIYGGTLNVESGELVVNRAKVVLTQNDVVMIGSQNFYFYPAIYAAKDKYNTISDKLVTATPQSLTGVYVNIYGAIKIVPPVEYSSVADLMTAYGGNIEVVYELATPYTIHLTPAQVRLLQGNNVVTTNGISIKLTYRNGELATLADVSSVAESVNVLGEQTMAIEPILNGSAKNLMIYDAVTEVIDGITWTVNPDMSITANGTASANSKKILTLKTTLPSSALILTGTPSGGSMNTFFQRASNSRITYWVIDTGNGTNIPLGGGSIITRVELFVLSGITVNNITFKPMIRDARIFDATYVPPAMTNRELTNRVKDLDSHVAKRNEISLLSHLDESSSSYWSGNTLVFKNMKRWNSNLYRLRCMSSLSSVNYVDTYFVLRSTEQTIYKKDLYEIPQLQYDYTNDVLTITLPATTYWIVSLSLIVSAKYTEEGL